MTRFISTALISASILALAACSASSDEEAATTDITSSSADMAMTEAATAPGGMAGVSERANLPVTMPKMAYVLDYGFRLAGEAIAPLQQKHADMCEAQGPYACRIVSLTRSGEDEEAVRGELKLAIAADKARAFAIQLSDAAEAAGGEPFKTDITGEDLSKSIVDTEARVRSRIALRDRLLEVLETRRGTVQELVDAERNVAAVNEEIDQAQSWLKEQSGRVEYSQLTITYQQADAGGSFLAPIRTVVGSLGAILGTVTSILILLGAVGLPVALGVLGVRRLRRRLGWGASPA